MLRVLHLRKQLGDLNTELEALTRAAEGFQTREADIANDIDQATTEEDRAAVENAIGAYEADVEANNTRSNELRTQIEALEAEIRTAEEAANSARRAASAPATKEREANMSYNVRAAMFGATAAEQQEFIAREDVKTFLQRVRELRGQQRTVTGAELGIPTCFMDVMRPMIERQSKLLGRIYCKPLKGKGRQNIVGAVPEAVWTEAYGAINQLDVVFNAIELDGFKVGGYIALPNCELEDDNDLNLAVTLADEISGAIAKAVDKAIIYGTGTKMPVGFVTRLAASSQPAWWGTNQGAFTDLHSSNVMKLNIQSETGTNAFFIPLMQALSKADPKYSDGKAVWVMNRKTHVDLMTHALEANQAGAIVAGMQNQMPIIGGEIVELDFMPDYEIAGGFLSLERFVEREGSMIEASKEAMFIEDMTVIKGTARYDGKCARGEGFVLVNYNNVDPTTTTTFGADYANTAMNTLICTAAAGTASGDTVLTVSGAKADSPTLKYKKPATTAGIKVGDTIGTGWTSLTSGTTQITATAGTPIAVVEVDASGKCVSAGNVNSVPKT